MEATVVMLQIRLLGEQRVTVEGRVPEALRSTRALSLLAYLALHAGAPQRRQHIAGIFWPDSTEAQARTNLRRELHKLRSVLPDPDRYLEIGDSTVQWRDDTPSTVDLVDFQRAAEEAETASADDDSQRFVAAARRAVRGYGGNLLPGAYDEWVLTERERLRRTCMRLLDQLATVLAAGGEVEEAVTHAQRRTELEPLEEVGYRRLMRLQVQAGDRAAALRTFHRCTSVLEGELGLAPSADTVGAYEELIARPPEDAPSTRGVRGTIPLVGRHDELASLRARWEELTSGPRLVLVAGEAGVGKSRVAAEFAGQVARAGATVARARAFATRGRLALAPVAEWLRAPRLQSGAAQLEPGWRLEVARLLPELGDGSGPDRSAPLTDAWHRRRFFEGLARAVLAADPPTLLLLDDLQWCDVETLAWLELLLQLEPAAPLMVVATFRHEELPDHPEVAAWCRRLRAAGLLEELALAPLGVTATAELVAAMTGEHPDEDTARRLMKETAGFPLLVVESLRQDPAGSARVGAVLEGRFEHLDPAAEELVSLASAVGRDFPLELLATAGVLDDTTLVKSVDELWRRRLLREQSSTTYDFSHDLLRDAAYERLSPPHRRLLHRRIAAALEELHADDPEPVAAQIAEQYERGGQPDRASRHHALAAEAATVVFAHDDAVEHYERAIALLGELPAGSGRDRQELELREACVPSFVALSGYAEPRLGRSLERMVELADRLGDGAAALRCRAALSAHLTVQGRIHEDAELTAQLMDRVDDEPDHVGQLCVARTWSLTSLGRLEEALEPLGVLEERTESMEVSPLGFSIRVMGLAWRAQTLWLLGRAQEAARDIDAALELAPLFDNPLTMAIAQGYGALVARLLGDVRRTGALAEELGELCGRYDLAYYANWGRILNGWSLGGERGEAAIRDGIAGLDRQHAGRARPFWLALLAEVLIDQDRGEEAAQVLAQARAWAEERGDRWWLAELWRLDAAGRRAEDAEPMLDRALAVAGEQGAVALELRAATDLARRWHSTGRDAEEVLGPVLARAAGCNRADVDAAEQLLARARA